MSYLERPLVRALVVVCVLALALMGGSVAAAAPGQLDGSYAAGGIFTAPFQTEPSAGPPRDQSATVDSQRRTVIEATHTDAQNRRHLEVVRLTAQGTLDTSFNPSGPTPGIVEVDFSAYVGTIDVYARGVAVVGGDKIVALGWVHDTSGNDFTALARLNSDGSYDTTFGANHDGRTVDSTTNYTGFPDSLAVDNLGRILVGGSCGAGCRGVVARYTSTGARDTTGFNAGDAVHPGVVSIAQGSDVSSLALTTDGSGEILAADGSSTSDEGVIARIRPDGTLDTTFGAAGPTPGVVESGMGCLACTSSGGASAFGVTPGPGGSVYTTGQVSDPGGIQSMRLLRLTQAGNPDPGFGTGSPAPGVVTAPGGIRGVSVAVDASACPVITGYGLRSDQVVPNARIVAARFTPAGALDQAFNPSGPTPGTAAFELGDRALGETVALQDDGKIVIGGEVDRFGQTTTRHPVTLRLQGGGCGTKQPARPAVVTGQASNVSSNAVTLNGTVNPNGSQVTDCHFEYGTSTTTYGSSVPCSQSPGAGTSPVAVSAPISGLAPNTTYDYRLVASNVSGPTYGNNQTLRTSPSGTLTTLSTVQVWGMTRGPSITVSGSATGEHDEAQLSGANVGSASGSFAFSLYRQAPSGPQCTGTPVFTSTVALLPVEGGGTSSDPVAAQLAPGSYYWVVSYSGDNANQPSTSACGSEVLTVAPFRISPFGALISAQSLTLRMTCTSLCTVRITITLPAPLATSDAQQNQKSKPRVITLARGRVTIRKHGAQTVSLHLTAAGRKFVASHKGRVTVTVAAAMTIHGRTRVVEQRLRIKIMKARKR